MFATQNAVTIKDPQLLASDPTTSVFVSASAGTGKTKILCDRFLNLMLSCADASHIMCITYTKSAAAEMKERITDLASSWSHMDETKLSGIVGAQNVEKAKGLYNKILLEKYRLNISTLHSFCLDVLFKYSESFQKRVASILDPTLKRNIFARILDDMRLAMRHEENSELKQAFLYLSKMYTMHTIDERITEALTRLSDFENYISKLDLDNLDRAIYQKHGSEADFDIDKATSDFFLETPAHFVDALRSLQYAESKVLPLLDAICSADLKQYKSALLTQAGTPRVLCKNKKCESICPNILELLADEFARFERFNQSVKNYKSAKINIAFLRLTLAVYNEYKALKAQKHLLDYDDIVNEAISLIADDPEVLYKLDYKIDHILVDEAQDLSAVQWDLIKTLSSDFFSGASVRSKLRTVFVVGDFKQSIFGFQGARPELFLKTAEYYKSLVESAGQKWRQVEMNKSYRSVPAILDSVNAVCEPLFNIYHTHVPHKTSLGHVQVWPLATRKKNEKAEDDLWTMPRATLDDDADVELANKVASTIVSWIGNRNISGTDRIVSASDIMILVRKRSVMVDILKSTLKRHGIKVSAPSHGALQHELAIQDCLSIVRFIAYPNDDLNIAGLLKSPFFNISEEKLFDICNTRGKSNVAQYLSENEVGIHESLSVLNKLFAQYDLYSAFHQLLYKDSISQNFVARFGYDVIYVLDSFMEALLSFQSLDVRGGFESFLQYMQDYYASHTTPPDCLRIMTVHSAKGLQAPIVIMVDASSSGQSVVESVFYDNGELYFAPANTDSSDVIMRIKEANKDSVRAESDRLLYVAMTRAENELFVTGVENNKLKGSWYDLIQNTAPTSDDQYNLCDADTQESENEQAYDFEFIKIKQHDFNSDYFTLSHDAVVKGEIIHRILEDAHNKTIDLDAINLKYSHVFSRAEIEEFYAEAMRVVEKYPDIFDETKGARCEQEVVFLKDGEHKTVRIDKLIITDSEIKIIDFKTDENPPSGTDKIRSEYIDQLYGYREILTKQFPHHKISCYLLWTRIPDLSSI